MTAPRKTGRTQQQSVAEKRVQEIATLMIAQAWEPSQIPRLAKRWRCKEPNVRRVAAEASRLIKSHMSGQGDEIRERVLASLQRIANIGITNVRGLSSAVKALDLTCRIYGLLAPTEASVTHSVDTMTADQLAEYEKKLLKDLKSNA